MPLRLFAVVLVLPTLLGAGPPPQTPAQRGKTNLLTKNYNPPVWARSAYDDLWQHWGVKAKPGAAEFDRQLRERYGLHSAPYPNDGLPMGLRQANLALGLRKGVTTDCLLCH